MKSSINLHIDEVEALEEESLRKKYKPDDVRRIKDFKANKTIHEHFMKEALVQARKAAKNGDVPIGCVIVMDGEIIARSYNKRNKLKSALEHAEIICIRKACKKLEDWRLDNATMYVTLEPCQMCAGAIIQSRISEVYIGAMSGKAGCVGSVVDLLHVGKFNHAPFTIRGLLEDRCSEVLSDFFDKLRLEKGTK
ncbi:MAG: tRNA adenosine(34) deaminase TadA [Lachnospiraceae bacterium]|nr:tRNA adenosine(34) deaminase TadA [Lachnospiraceae bacterium]